MTAPDPYDAGKDYSDSWALAHQTIRKIGMLAGKYEPQEGNEDRFLNWEVR